jgi:two-component sensor histidine kinase
VDLYDEMHGRRAGSMVLEILNAAERGLMATTDLMLAGKLDGLSDDHAIDIRRELLAMEPILRRLATPGVDFEMRTDGAPVFVCIDRTSLMQILMNLVVNAADVLCNDGAISVHTARGVRSVTPGEAAVPVFSISVSDDGSGMTPELLELIFDDGFSTKQGPHAGLGLAVVRRVVERCSGWIEVESTVGAGTTFRVEFPVQAPPTSGTALVVVADDLARVSIVDVLEHFDLHVLVAAESLEACDLLAAGIVPDIAVLDTASASDRGLWQVAKLDHVQRTTAVGSESSPLPQTFDAAMALIIGCTEPTVPSPVTARELQPSPPPAWQRPPAISP